MSALCQKWTSSNLVCWTFLMPSRRIDGLLHNHVECGYESKSGREKIYGYCSE